MKMRDRICVGSRESRLAVIQSRIVMEYIQRNNPGMQVDLLTMKTTGTRSWTGLWIRWEEKGFL